MIARSNTLILEVIDGTVNKRVTPQLLVISAGLEERLNATVVRKSKGPETEISKSNLIAKNAEICIKQGLITTTPVVTRDTALSAYRP